MSDLQLSLIVSTTLSALIASVQLTQDSNIYRPRSYFSFMVVTYLIIIIFGNVLTTLVSASVIDSYLMDQDSSEQDGFKLVGVPWFWYSALGVFAFEAIVQKINLTFFDKGVLSINDWIDKAKHTAVAAILNRTVNWEVIHIEQMAQRLLDKLSSKEIHTHAQTILGLDQYQALLSEIDGDDNTIVELYLAKVVANEAPERVNAILATRGS